MNDTINEEKQKQGKSAPSFHDDSDTEGIEQLLHSQSNLLSQTLLNLKTTTEHLCQTRNLAQSNHLSVLWDITNMDLNHIKQKREGGKPLILKYIDDQVEQAKRSAMCCPDCCTLPVKGTMWCSQREKTSMFLTITISS